MIKDGIINVYKPQNMTSHDVVAIMRRTLGIKKIGHTGTLDPMATGVLPICIGKSAKIMEYLDMDIKTYLCTMKLGVITDTQDIWGKILETRDASEITLDQVKASCSAFDGVIEQKPPMYSALKVNGKKLYEYARAGESVEVKTRKIYIKSFEIIDFDEESKELTFRTECTKGTYIRTICQDIGEKLGCGACMTALERVASGAFTKENSTDIEILRNMSCEGIEEKIIPTQFSLENFGECLVEGSDLFIFLNGGRIPKVRWTEKKAPVYRDRDFYLPMREEFKTAYNVYGEIDGKREFLGVAFVRGNGLLKADKIFYSR